MKEYKVICPLINFQIQNVLFGSTGLSQEEIVNLLKKRKNELVKGIDLLDGIKIRRVSGEDMEDIKTYSFPLPIPPQMSISRSMFVLEKYISEEEEHRFEIHRVMLNGVLALRLLKKGNVWGGSVFCILVSEKRQLTSMSWEEEPIPESYGPGYVLKFDEIPALKKILEKVQGMDFTKRKSLHLACKRFQRAYGESDAEDRLIDLMIAFEALFLRGEKAGSSAGQIVAVACSALLGKNDEEREEVRGFLTKAYSIRNCIVHGSEYKEPIVYKNKEYNMSEFVSKIEEYLREAIKKFLG